MTGRFIGVVAVVVVLISAVCPVVALDLVPGSISYQGKLTDSSGQAVPDGDRGFIFSLYTNPTPVEGESPISSQSETLTVKGGLFTTHLLLTPDVLVDQQNVYLEVTVNGQKLSPRVALVSAPFALKAGDLTMPFTRTISGRGISIVTNGLSANAGYFKIENAASAESAVYGATTGSGAGVYGMTTFMGAGVEGNGAGLWSAGVFGTNTSGPGIIGYSETGNGVEGTCASGTAAGVSGSSTEGNGVEGTTSSDTKAGVLGSGSAHGTGVRGDTSSGTGVYGFCQGGLAYDPTASGVTGEGNNATGVIGKSVSAPGVRGTSDHVMAILGESNGTDAAGVKGTGDYGVQGTSYKEGSVGIDYITYGGPGVYGESSQLAGIGVKGAATGNYSVGVWAESAGYAGQGLHAVGNHVGVSASGFNQGLAASSDVGTAVYGITTSGYAGYFVGPVTVTGYLTKSGGGFKIDHPLDPENKYLNHSFVESPDMKNVYDGTVVLGEKGEAVVEMPDWFEAENKDFRYQLTCIGGYAPVYIAEEVKDNEFKIAGGRPGLKVSWMVTGIRKDAWAEANRPVVEEDKPESLQGKYLNPEAFGEPRTAAITR